jgi:hypothetical protein
LFATLSCHDDPTDFDDGLNQPTFRFKKNARTSDGRDSGSLRGDELMSRNVRRVETP